jgi:peroxin-1
MSSDVDLAVLAAQSDGFSGADLQAMVYNAHLDVVHQSITSSSSLAAKPGKESSIKQEQEQGWKYRQIAPPQTEEDTNAARAEMDKKVSFVSWKVWI